MKPLSPHWADIAALKLVQANPDQESFVIASGITPSGVVHIGNFREVVTVEFVSRALKSLGKKVRFIYSWDDFDTFRKVPENLPNQAMLKDHLRKPINRVPDPHGIESSYARSNEVAFEKDLSIVGIHPHFIYQSTQYQSGVYTEQIVTALKNRSIIAKILNQYRKDPLDESWLPTGVYCEICEKDDVINEQYDGEYGYAYFCNTCKQQVNIDIRQSRNVKLAWRTDWPMRWSYEKVDFEPGGKDHSSEGGSFDTGKQIVKSIWNREAPQFLQYDFVSIKGLGMKMSSSKGVLLTLGQALNVYAPEMVRWIFACQRANHDFSIAFDEDVIKVYEEFDRAESAAFGEDNKAKEDKKWPMLRRCMELAMLNEDIPTQIPFRAPFRELCTKLQICDGNIERCKDRFYRDQILDESDQVSFEERAKRALFWLKSHAPEDFTFQLRSVKSADPGSTGLANLRALISRTDLESVDAKELNQLIYDEVIHANSLDPKAFFQEAYQALIERDVGPRLPLFLKEIGKDRLLTLL
jgi:lysyl-tRNA synthetase, class I